MIVVHVDCSSTSKYCSCLFFYVCFLGFCLFVVFWLEGHALKHKQDTRFEVPQL